MCEFSPSGQHVLCREIPSIEFDSKKIIAKSAAVSLRAGPRSFKFELLRRWYNRLQTWLPFKIVSRYIKVEIT